jgi:hypothetical protein
LPDVDSIDDYGGVLVDERPVDDPTSQRSAGQVNAAFDSAAGATHVVARAWARIVLGVAPTLAMSNPNDAVWGVAPAPVPAHTGTGAYTLTFPATVSDEIGNPHSLNLRWADFTIEGATFGFAQGFISSANVVTFSTGDSAGAPNNLSGITLLVRVG